MRPTRGVSLVLAMAMLSALAVCSAQQTFRSGVSLVLVDLRVIDRNYQSIPELEPENVEVLVDGEPRALRDDKPHKIEA